jgi:hypothetical protein
MGKLVIKSKQHLTVRSGVKAGGWGLILNHNQTLLRR